MIIYRGYRTSVGCLVTVDHGPSSKPLPLRQDLVNHSPDGAEWGYCGSGPAQLALGLACHALGNDREALEIYQDLKARLVAGWEHDVWEIDQIALLSVISDIRKMRRRDQMSERSNANYWKNRARNGRGQAGRDMPGHYRPRKAKGGKADEE